MDVVALLIITLFVLSGTLTLPQALAGFSDPNVIPDRRPVRGGEGWCTGIAYQVGMPPEDGRQQRPACWCC